MRVLAAYNIKGGVGKTSTAVNLAFLAAREGARVLLCDLDPQGAATYCFRVKGKLRGGARGLVRRKHPLEELIRGTDFEGLDLLPADFSYRNLDLVLDATRKAERRLAQRIRPLDDRYDYVVFDCAPSISLVSESIFVAAEALIVPTIPTTLSVRMVKRLVKHLAREKLHVDVLPFFCMVDRRKALHREICAKAATSSIPFLATRIPFASVVERMSVERAPLGTFAKATPAARAYVALWREVADHLDRRRTDRGSG